ncbi:histone H3.3-like type 1 [Chrysoperla carnea]|uniref:histone H3.3-like type 1 n=1 Tax=Chrysoperla carnea TaxID=189513 RepID=UPI001D095A28|nr:histone H3.3-like type 1 [Chrysoperla carnea]
MASNRSRSTGESIIWRRRNIYRRRYSYYDNIFREIRHYQRTTNSLVPKAAIVRVIKSILPQHIRIQRSAVEALQESVEVYIVQFLSDSDLCTFNAKRRTLMTKDMLLTRRIRGRADIINK